MSTVAQESAPGSAAFALPNRQTFWPGSDGVLPNWPESRGARPKGHRPVAASCSCPPRPVEHPPPALLRVTFPPPPPWACTVHRMKPGSGASHPTRCGPQGPQTQLELKFQAPSSLLAPWARTGLSGPFCPSEAPAWTMGIPEEAEIWGAGGCQVHGVLHPGEWPCSLDPQDATGYRLMVEGMAGWSCLMVEGVSRLSPV